MKQNRKKFWRNKSKLEKQVVRIYKNFKVQNRIFTLVSVLNLLLPHSRISSNSCGKGAMYVHQVTRKIYSNWQRRQKCIVFSGSILQEHSGFIVSSKLYLNLFSRERLKSNANLVSGLIPTWP